MARAKRTKPKIRKELVLHAAIEVSKHVGYKRITRDAVAKSAGVSSPLIANYYPRMSQLKTAVMDAAIKQGIIEIIAQGLTLNDPRALKVSHVIKRKVTHYLLNK